MCTTIPLKLLAASYTVVLPQSFSSPAADFMQLATLQDRTVAGLCTNGGLYEPPFQHDLCHLVNLLASRSGKIFRQVLGLPAVSLTVLEFLEGSLADRQWQFDMDRMQDAFHDEWEIDSDGHMHPRGEGDSDSSAYLDSPGQIAPESSESDDASISSGFDTHSSEMPPTPSERSPVVSEHNIE